ncbi:MAG TPA: molybdopterin cofactor-binding domain-containing protein [Anaerolineae bacterium]|nr:molybdopterin cofactor-binding domain-containing protein [Anaerolineae bacterium]
MSQQLNIIGKPNRKVDALQKVSGQTMYAADLSLPRMLHCKILRSIHPHARIVAIDTSAAKALPGVMAVITGQDLPNKFGILPVSQDEESLVIEKVRYVGDPVAAVAAADEETAEAALKHIRVEYEVMPPIMSIEEGVQPLNGHEPIHAYADQDNIHKLVALEFGEVEAGLAEADLIQEDIFFYEGNTHLPMEEHAALARYEANGKLTVWTSTQCPHYVHKAMAGVLDLPPSHIRIIAPPTGGGFGGKTDPFSHEMIVAKLAMLTGRPVKIVLTREEVFYAHRGRHPVLMRVKTGVKKDGAITAMHFQSFLDGGGYGSYGVASTYYTGALQTVTYNIPVYKFDGARVFTNKPPCGPKRGHGTPQPRFALEVQLDKIAEKLGLNPLDIRLNHLASPYTKTANHLTVTTIGLRECLEAVAERSGFREMYGRLPLGKGVGLACGAYITGAGLPIYWNKMPHSGVQLKIDRGGGVTVFCGSTDIGQGSDSILAYIVAEELGISLDHISLFTADTDLTPVDLGSYSSRVTLMTGNAAIQAARKLRSLLFETAAKELMVPQESLIACDNAVFCLDDETRRIPFPDLVKLAEAQHGTLGAVGSYTPPRRGGRYKGAGVGPTPAYTYAACVAAVDVDVDTGQVTVEKIWIAHDIGKAINPLLVEGQVEGSVYMGLGEALMEEQVFRRGLHKIPSMLDYKSPTFLETPDIETILVETNDPDGPYGAKEAGQGPLLPVIPAVANAVYDAVGVRIDEVPITPEKVFKALREKAKGGEARVGPKGVPHVVFPEPVRAESQWGMAAEEQGN